MLIALGYDHRGKNMARQLVTEVFWPTESVAEDSAIMDVRRRLLQKDPGENSFSGILIEERNGESDLRNEGRVRSDYWEGALLIGGDFKGKNFIGQKIEFLKSSKYLQYNPPVMGEKTANSNFLHIDYPDVAAAVAEKVSRKEVDYGILIDGTGIGMSVVANKFRGVRAALCFNHTAAELSRRHNNANVLCLPGEMLGKMSIATMVTCWLSATYEGERHQRRLDKIAQIEEKTGL